MCVGLWWSLYFQELLLQLHDLPFALLGMIGEFDGDSEQGEAASALQTALKRHVITRCEVLFQGEFHSLLRAALDAIHVSHGAFICVFFIEHSYVCVFVCARVACVSTRIHVLSTRL